MKLGRVEEVGDGRPPARQEWVSDDDVGVAVSVDDIEADQVRHDHEPVVVSEDKVWEEESWAKGGNVDEMFVEVLDDGRGGQSLD